MRTIGHGPLLDNRWSTRKHEELHRANRLFIHMTSPQPQHILMKSTLILRKIDVGYWLVSLSPLRAFIYCRARMELDKDWKKNWVIRKFLISYSRQRRKSILLCIIIILLFISEKEVYFKINVWYTSTIW